MHCLHWFVPTWRVYPHSDDEKMRVATVLAHAIMDTMLAFMSHFPLFSIMLRVKDPRRLPGKSPSCTSIPDTEWSAAQEGYTLSPARLHLSSR
jgi:hypothetical protein